MIAEVNRVSMVRPVGRGGGGCALTRFTFVRSAPSVA